MALVGYPVTGGTTMTRLDRKSRRAHTIGRALLLVMTLILANGCQSTDVNGDTMPHGDINAVKDAHANELMAIPGVTGVAIGALEEGSDRLCILVLVVEVTDSITSQIPKTLEGHPVRIFVSGEIKPLDDE
jgi:hypothetical protein